MRRWIGDIIGILLASVAVGEQEINNITSNAMGKAPGLDDLRQNFTAPDHLEQLEGFRAAGGGSQRLPSVGWRLVELSRTMMEAGRL